MCAPSLLIETRGAKSTKKGIYCDQSGNLEKRNIVCPGTLVCRRNFNVVSDKKENGK